MTMRGRPRRPGRQPTADATASGTVRRGSLQQEAELRQAVRQDQLTVHYQPIVDLRLATIVGTEALARWEHPHRGLVMPGEFIPLAEECGLIWEVGVQVLRQACRDAASWAASGRPITCTVNAAGSQLVPAFVEVVREALAIAGLAPGLLAIEITETTLDEEADLAVLHALRALGVRIALDDFGVGYSSLSRLRDLPVDIVKIDGSFARGLERSEADRQLATGLLAMTAALGKYTIFEGIETPGALATLTHMQVDAVQGFVFSRARPREDFAELLRRGLGALLAGSSVVIREIVDPQALFEPGRAAPPGGAEPGRSPSSG